MHPLVIYDEKKFHKRINLLQFEFFSSRICQGIRKIIIFPMVLWLYDLGYKSYWIVAQYTKIRHKFTKKNLRDNTFACPLNCTFWQFFFVKSDFTKFFLHFSPWFFKALCKQWQQLFPRHMSFLININWFTQDQTKIPVTHFPFFRQYYLGDTLFIYLLLSSIYMFLKLITLLFSKGNAYFAK